MKRKDWLAYTGLWTQPIIMALISYFIDIDVNFIMNHFKNFISLFALSCAPAFYIWSQNSIAKNHGKQSFKLMDGLNQNLDPLYQSTLKTRAKYPIVSDSYLSSKPDGIILGKHQGKYVRKKTDEDGHIFVIGGSGSGKSTSIVIPTLLCNPDIGKFAIDIKGELSYKTCRLGDSNNLIFNPDDRCSWGYDPFYMLTPNSTDQEIMECMQLVAVSLISLSADIKEPYWKQNARNLMTGLLIYYYKQGYTNLPDICSEILKEPMKDIIDNATNKIEINSIENLYLGSYKGMADDTLSGISSEMTLHITIFATNQNIKYSFKENPKKLNPNMLNIGKNIYLSIKEEKLVIYYDILQLILNQTLSELEKRPEASTPILFIIDEMARILSQGKLEKLLDAARTLRSRKVTLLLVTQSIEALLSSFAEHQVDDLISNCSYVVVLSASTIKTQEKIISWSGKYKECKTSYTGVSKDRKKNISYEDKDIVEASDLVTLPDTGELILITPKGYNRIKKAPYYKIDTLNKLSSEIVRHNSTIKEELNSSFISEPIEQFTFKED